MTMVKHPADHEEALHVDSAKQNAVKKLSLSKGVGYCSARFSRLKTKIHN